jgi:superfamily II DNA or RNA helicase
MQSMLNGPRPPDGHFAAPLGAASFARCGDVQHCADEYVPTLHPVQGSTLLLDADCGLGKTTAIRRFMTELFAGNSAARVLIVSVRIVHALDLAAGLAECGVKPSLYTEYKGRERELVQQRCVVISAEQCMHLSLSDQRWDLVVLDEVRSLADKFKRHSDQRSQSQQRLV